jgi:hypothetical protein
LTEHSYAVVVANDLLTRRACDAIIEEAESASQWRGSATRQGGPASRSVMHLPTLTERIASEVLGAAIALNMEPQFELMSAPLCARYCRDDHFPLHTDASADLGGRMSRASAIIYLNDTALGGATWFPDLDLRHQPACGCALLFPHGVRHAGERVTRDIKYILHILLG